MSTHQQPAVTVTQQPPPMWYENLSWWLVFKSLTALSISSNARVNDDQRTRGNSRRLLSNPISNIIMLQTSLFFFTTRVRPAPKLYSQSYSCRPASSALQQTSSLDENRNALALDRALNIQLNLTCMIPYLKICQPIRTRYVHIAQQGSTKVDD